MKFTASFAATLMLAAPAVAASDVCTTNEITAESSAIAYAGDIQSVDRAFENADGDRVWRVPAENLTEIGEYFADLEPAWKTPTGVWSLSAIKAVIRSEAGDCHIVADTEDLYVLLAHNSGYIVTGLRNSDAQQLRDLLAKPMIQAAE